MSPIKFFLLLLCLVLVFSLIPSVNAIIEKEYQHEIWSLSGDNPTRLDCLFKVRVVIETAQDGTWKTDGSYILYLFLEITYFNETHFEGDQLNFTRGTGDQLYFTDTGEEEKYVFADEDSTSYYFNDYFSHLLVNSPVNEQQMTTVRFFPKEQGTLSIYPELTIKDVKSHGGDSYPYFWGNSSDNPPASIDIEVKASSTISSSDLIFLATGTIFGVTLIGVIFMVKRRKKSTSLA